MLFRKSVQRPPWTDESNVRARCTSCGDCIQSCPENILIPGPALTPMIDFMSGACTFCGACAAACNEHVFNDVTDTPWTLVVNVSDECLLPRGVSCQSCTDACDVRALRFDLRQRPLGALRLDSTACTGCGACIGTCPVNALSLAETATQAKSV